MCNMLLASIVLMVFVLGSIGARVSYDLDYPLGSCPNPRLEHGRVRLRQHSRLARFACLPRYMLVGNRYATCRNGHWDVPIPICVRPSCPIPDLKNGFSMTSYQGAWVIFFCYPKFELVGSPTIYCDGIRWNSTAPTCIDTTAGPALSCDFEDPWLCGWRQDEFHDFDWQRINSTTPSTFLFTGPSFDHTLGKGKYGHYMYIESTSQNENDTARLISPVYDPSLTDDGCFSFAYHMYGRTTGGLRVYQKPNNITRKRLLDLGEEERQKYLLFEKWGNLGDNWFTSVTPLKKFSVDFQIMIEGIRGSSYTSDIAVDDVAILQGTNCTDAARFATTPSNIMPDSCVGRCALTSKYQDEFDTRCSCSVLCFFNETCCPDFFDVCLFSPDSTTADTMSSSEAEPQTLKLVSVTKETTSTSTTTSTTTTTPTPTTTSTKRYTTPFTRRTTPKSTSTPKTTSTTSITTTTTTRRPTTRNPITTSRKPYTTQTPRATSKTARKTSPRTYYTRVTTKRPTSVYPVTYNDIIESASKANKEVLIERQGSTVQKPIKVIPVPEGMSTGSQVALIIIILAILTVSAMVVHASLRTTRGRMVLARLRGYRERDSEVRYLTSDVDDE